MSEVLFSSRFFVRVLKDVSWRRGSIENWMEWYGDIFTVRSTSADAETGFSRGLSIPN